MDIDTSGISFTALYTGEVWRRNGLSAPFLTSRLGQSLYLAAKPFEWLSKAAWGANNELILLQRHRIIDHLLEEAISACPDLQVVEIACGLSPRGVRFCERYPELTYLEADLPEMAARKRTLLQAAGRLTARHRVVECNILAEDGDIALEAVFARELDGQRPVVVITEGLINYFSLETVSGFWRRLAQLLKTFPSGSYLTDLYPGYEWHSFVRVANRLKGALALATHAEVNLHFGNDQEAISHFRECGFEQARVHVPECYYGALDIPVQRIPSVVRIVEMQAG